MIVLLVVQMREHAGDDWLEHAVILHGRRAAAGPEPQRQEVARVILRDWTLADRKSVV